MSGLSPYITGTAWSSAWPRCRADLFRLLDSFEIARDSSPRVELVVVVEQVGDRGPRGQDRDRIPRPEIEPFKVVSEGKSLRGAQGCFPTSAAPTLGCGACVILRLVPCLF